jgi:hypothetical protein
MDITTALILLGFLFVFGLVVYLSIQSSRKELQNKRQLAQNLGFTPIEADEKLIIKISSPYRLPGTKNQFMIQNVSRKVIPDGEIYLFDLLETSSDENTTSENQAVAVTSQYLNIPQFTFFPKADPKYALSGMANRVMEWAMSRVGRATTFPEFPEFNARYIVTSDNDPQFIRAFLDSRRAQFFAQTQLYTLHALGDMFTFSEVDPQFKKLDQEILSRRVNRALEIFRQFQTRSSQ